MARQTPDQTRTVNAYSKLDWPTPEMLAAANRARARALREMVIATARSVGKLVRERLLAPKRTGRTAPKQP
jgi:hypothetical protein